MEETDTLPEAPAPADSRILARLASGLPLAIRPYEAAGADLGLSEDEVLAGTRFLHDTRAIRRTTGALWGVSCR